MTAAELLAAWTRWFDQTLQDCEEAEYTDTDLLWSDLYAWRERFAETVRDGGKR